MKADAASATFATATPITATFGLVDANLKHSDSDHDLHFEKALVSRRMI